jgi:hypothetical protein
MGEQLEEMAIVAYRVALVPLIGEVGGSGTLVERLKCEVVMRRKRLEGMLKETADKIGDKLNGVNYWTSCGGDVNKASAAIKIGTGIIRLYATEQDIGEICGNSRSTYQIHVIGHPQAEQVPAWSAKLAEAGFQCTILRPDNYVCKLN